MFPPTSFEDFNAVQTVFANTAPVAGLARLQKLRNLFQCLLKGLGWRKRHATTMSASSHVSKEQLAGQIDEGHGPSWAMRKVESWSPNSQNKKLLGAPGLTTRSKDATRSCFRESWSPIASTSWTCCAFSGPLPRPSFCAKAWCSPVQCLFQSSSWK